MSLITYPLNNVTYSAEDAELFHATRTSGVFANDSFPITATGADNSVKIGTGIGWIRNGEFAGKVVALKTAQTLEFDLSDSVYPRIDAVVIQFSTVNNATDLIIKKGVASTSPSAPAVVRDESIYELHLYHVRRNAGALVVTESDITDLRLDANYCGLMADAVTDWDKEAINKQIEELMANYWNKTETIPINNGGTGAKTATQAVNNLGAVPNTRTVNGKALSSNITLSADDVDAVSLYRGTAISENTDANDLTTPGNYYVSLTATANTIKNVPFTTGSFLFEVREGAYSGSLIQRQIVNGSEYTPIYIRNYRPSLGWSDWYTDMKSINGILPEDTTGNVKIGPENIGAVPTTRTVNGKPLSSNITLNASDFNIKPNDIGALAVTQGTTIPSEADMNTYTTPGVYAVLNGTTAATILNLPYKSAASRIEVLNGGYNDGRIQRQICTGLKGAPIYSRRGNYNDDKSAWEWTDWERNVFQSRTINGKDLSSNITLDADDVDAINLYRGVAIASNTNMDNLKTPGNYYIAQTDVANTITNLPFTAGSSRVIVTEGAYADTLFQIQIVNGSEYTPVYIRNYRPNLGWSGWYTSVKSVNGKKPESTNGEITLTASDISAVPTTRTVNGKALSSDITLSASDFKNANTSVAVTYGTTMATSSSTLRYNSFLDACFFRGYFTLTSGAMADEYITIASIPSGYRPSDRHALAVSSFTPADAVIAADGVMQIRFKEAVPASTYHIYVTGFWLT